MFNKKVVFDYPKPVKLIKQMINLYTNPNDNDIILDFFAGSGTTAQAVMELNAEDGGNRKFILMKIRRYWPKGQYFLCLFIYNKNIFYLNLWF